MAHSHRWTDTPTRSLSIRLPADIQCDQAFKNYTSTGCSYLATSSNKTR